MSDPNVYDVVVVGAGVAGIAAAQDLRSAGLSVKVVESSSAVGGRMTSIQIGEAIFDHGAQFFTTRSAEFRELVDGALAAGVVSEWTAGFGSEPDGFSRWCGVGGMAALIEWMAVGIEVALNTSVSDLRAHPARAYIVTPPMPQTMAILSQSNLLPSPNLTARLTNEILYRPTIAVLVNYAGSTSMGAHGGSQTPSNEAVSFIGDNFVKGISTERSLTLHLSEQWSNDLWDVTDEGIIARSWEAAADRVRPAELLNAAVYRWRYAGPTRMWPSATEVWGDEPIVALAGEAFDGPKVEGAFLSGRAAAQAVIDRLEVR